MRVTSKVSETKIITGHAKIIPILKYDAIPNCPQCKDRLVGRINTNLFFCRECCIEFKWDKFEGKARKIEFVDKRRRA